ncbi:F-box/WD repeat-containing protein 4-like [Ornithodoros turicata]|uniref:F-box/WD repeat-containing protein 4-like n=1 Tax=Ornithodoros turicata TaxID=34597 RepID=UPI00313971EB
MAQVESPILSLPPDVLYVILSYCDIRTLGRLSCVSSYFYHFLKQNCVWNQRSKNAIATNQLDRKVLLRSRHILGAVEKCWIALNWQKGRYNEKTLLQLYTTYMPWLVLESSTLWYSKGATILKLARLGNGRLAKRPLLSLSGHADDVGRFVCKNGLVVSGGNDGSLWIWTSSDGLYLHNRWRCHTQAINSVDYGDKVVVTGSRDRTVKVWTLHDWSSTLGYSVPVGDRVCAVSLSPCGSFFLCGSAGCNGVPPLQLYDLGTGSRVSVLGSGYRNGAGVLHLQPESPMEVLSCGYDTFVRLWDLRCPTHSVRAWEDPHDSTVYCIASDHHMTVVSGTNRYGVVRLWDKRTTRPMQMYYVGHGNSPVYSLAFDPCYLYAALDRSLNLLSFAGPTWNPQSDPADAR